jgi:hypothetical protein
VNPCEYLARVGFDALLSRAGGPTTPVWVDEDDDAAVRAAEATARLADHARIRKLLLSVKPSPRDGDLVGARWIAGGVTWPDRVPGLKTWGGQQTLPKIIAGCQKLIARATETDLFALRAFREGSPGFDAPTCQNSIDIGFVPGQLDIPVECRPAVELLAIVGLETLPLVSFGARTCGFLHDGRIWRFEVEDRTGGYLKRWGSLAEVPLLLDQMWEFTP